MFSGFLDPGFFPFTVSLGLFFGLVFLEVILLLLGGSLLGSEAEADLSDPDIGDMAFDADFDTDFDLDSDLEAGLDFGASQGLELGETEFDLSLALDGADTDTDLDMPQPDIEGFSWLAWFGFGQMPAAIWLASMLIGFGVIGAGVQIALMTTLGVTLPAGLVAVPAFFGARWLTCKFGRIFARLFPKITTESVSERHLGRRRGVVSQGSAARNRPAEVRVTDRHGNIQYLRAEPFRDDQVIPKGTEVIVMRHRRNEGYRIVPLSDINSK